MARDARQSRPTRRPAPTRRPPTRRTVPVPARRPVPGASLGLAAAFVTALLAAVAGCAAASAGSGAHRTVDALAWSDFALGMSAAEARSLSGEALDLRPVEDACGEAGARLSRGGRELFLGFTTPDPAAILHTIVVRLAPEESKEDVVRDLKRRFPGLRYHPDPRWPKMGEAENPKPLYVHSDLPDQGILVGAEEDWMWISHLRCLD